MPFSTLRPSCRVRPSRAAGEWPCRRLWRGKRGPLAGRIPARTDGVLGWGQRPSAPGSMLPKMRTRWKPDDSYLKRYLNRGRPSGAEVRLLPPTITEVVAMAKIKIENVVASTSLGGELDLQAIALALGGAEYEPEQFPGLIYRLKEPKTATLLFRSGKVVCTGAKSLEHVRTAIDTVAKQIEAAGIPIKKNPEIEVQNIVASSDLGTEINLNATAISLGLEKVEYEPEQFPGLVYRIDVPKVVVLLFGSGKLVCTGARKPSDVEEAVEKITQELKAAGLLR